jgi:hypothetical protein
MQLMSFVFNMPAYGGPGIRATTARCTGPATSGCRAPLTG